MADEEKKQDPPVKAVAVTLADLTGEEDEDEEELEGELEAEEAEAEAEAEAEKKAEPAAKASAGDMSNLLDDIFAEEAEEGSALRSFGDLEHLTMIEVAAEVEAVLEELRIRQGDNE